MLLLIQNTSVPMNHRINSAIRHVVKYWIYGGDASYTTGYIFQASSFFISLRNYDYLHMYPTKPVSDWLVSARTDSVGHINYNRPL